MKKIYTHIAIALMSVLTMTTLTGCETDSTIAYDLNGEWEGRMGESYYDHLGYESYAEYNTVMRFSRYGSSSYTYGSTTGDGEQIDYLGRYNTQYRTFRWSVDNGTIYIRYNNGEQLRIYDFSINSRYFNGIMEYYDSFNREVYSQVRFDFRKTYDYNYDWSKLPAVMTNDSITIEK